MTDFEIIYRKYFQYVYYYMLGICGSREIAEEVTQETFFTALTTKAKFQEKSDVRTWLCHIAKNKYISTLRKQKKIEKDVDLNSIEDHIDFSSQLLQKETAMRIHKYLHMLEEPYKEVFSLRVFGELPFKDIGMIFEKSDAWARVTFSRAKQKIKERMEQDEGRV